jgi:hypothetical protein
MIYKVMKKVFHATSVQGLMQIKPSSSTHGISWVYAARDWVMASVFISQVGQDFSCTVGREARSGLPFVCERFPGAISTRYGGRQGAIYTLPAVHFEPGRTAWLEELVSPLPVSPVAEVMVDEAAQFLYLLEAAKKLVIYRYPDRPEGTPADDSDLLERGLLWYRTEGASALQQIEQWQPGLIGRILRASQARKNDPMLTVNTHPLTRPAGGQAF